MNILWKLSIIRSPLERAPKMTAAESGRYRCVKADQLHSLKKIACCLKTSYFLNK